MADPTRWRGPKELTGGKDQWNFGAEKVTLDKTYTGPVELCRSNFPRFGEQIDGYAGMFVITCEIEELDAGAGVLHVHLDTQLNDSTISTAPLGDPVYEIEWQELQKPLETHPKCGILKPDRPRINQQTGAQRTWEDWAQLTPDDYDASGDKWSLSDYKSLKEKGIDNFSMGAPVVRRTLYYATHPSGVGADCFTPVDPPAAAHAPTLIAGKEIVWLQGIDKITKQGHKRTRNTEWIGAQAVESLIYSS